MESLQNSNREGETSIGQDDTLSSSIQPMEYTSEKKKVRDDKK